MMANKGELRQMIEEIMEQKFKKQEESLLQIISGNTKIQNESMKKILDQIGNIRTHVTEIEKKTT